jgi:hypothetical protein
MLEVLIDSHSLVANTPLPSLTNFTGALIDHYSPDLYLLIGYPVPKVNPVIIDFQNPDLDNTAGNLTHDPNKDIQNYINFPVDMIRGNGEDNWYVLGYSEQDQAEFSIKKGMVVTRVRVNFQAHKTGPAEAYQISTGFNNIYPSAIRQTQDNGFLILGSTLMPGETEKTNKINVIRLDNELNFVFQKSFGTGGEGDKGVKLEVLPDGSIVFLASVNYQLGTKPNTKIALYKLTPDLELDF